MRHGFRRTECACAECAACCRRQPGPLAPGDLARLLDRLTSWGMSQPEARSCFVASPGALVLDTGTGRTFRIGSITPRKVRGRCVFLDQSDRCRVHDVAPFGCAYFDTHQNVLVANTRGVWLAEAQMDPEYQALRATFRSQE